MQWQKRGREVSLISKLREVKQKNKKRRTVRSAKRLFADRRLTLIAFFFFFTFFSINSLARGEREQCFHKARLNNGSYIKRVSNERENSIGEFHFYSTGIRPSRIGMAYCLLVFSVDCFCFSTCKTMFLCSAE